MSQASLSGLHLETGGWHELFNESSKVALRLVRDIAFGTDGNGNVGSLGVDGLEVHLLELANLAGLDLVEVSTDTGEEDAGLLLDGHGHVLLLLEELGELLASVEELLGGGVQVRTELGEGGDLSVLSELELERTGKHLHGLDLGGRSDSGHGETDINGWADTLVEELSLKEDLTVSDGDNIGWNIGGHITGLGLNDGQGSEGATTLFVVHLGGTWK